MMKNLLGLVLLRLGRIRGLSLFVLLFLFGSFFFLCKYQIYTLFLELGNLVFELNRFVEKKSPFVKKLDSLPL